MLRQYFMQIHQEVIEAARLDDADNRKIMFKVMMPMAKPALITIGLLSFISTWNNYFWPLIMTSSETLRTLPVGIAALKSSETLQMWHIIIVSCHYHGRKRSFSTADPDRIHAGKPEDP